MPFSSRSLSPLNGDLRSSREMSLSLCVLRDVWLEMVLVCSTDVTMVLLMSGRRTECKPMYIGLLSELKNKNTKKISDLLLVWVVHSIHVWISKCKTCTQMKRHGWRKHPTWVKFEDVACICYMGDRQELWLAWGIYLKRPASIERDTVRLWCILLKLGPSVYELIIACVLCPLVRRTKF